MACTCMHIDLCKHQGHAKLAWILLMVCNDRTQSLKSIKPKSAPWQRALGVRDSKSIRRKMPCSRLHWEGVIPVLPGTSQIFQAQNAL